MFENILERKKWIDFWIALQNPTWDLRRSKNAMSILKNPSSTFFHFFLLFWKPIIGPDWLLKSEIKLACCLFRLCQVRSSWVAKLCSHLSTSRAVSGFNLKQTKNIKILCKAGQHQPPLFKTCIINE